MQSQNVQINFWGKSGVAAFIVGTHSSYSVKQLQLFASRAKEIARETGN